MSKELRGMLSQQQLQHSELLQPDTSSTHLSIDCDHDRDLSQRDAEGEERKGASNASYGLTLA